MKHRIEAIKTGNICPWCGSKEYEATQAKPEVDDNKVYLDMVCLDCDREWYETFILTDINEVDYKEID